MKKLITLCVFALCVSAPSFAAEHILSRFTEVVGQGTYKVTKVTVVDTAKAMDVTLRFVL
jgi:hypothetical protein